MGHRDGQAEWLKGLVDWILRGQSRGLLVLGEGQISLRDFLQGIEAPLQQSLAMPMDLKEHLILWNGKAPFLPVAFQQMLHLLQQRAAARAKDPKISGVPLPLMLLIEDPGEAFQEMEVMLSSLIFEEGGALDRNLLVIFFFSNLGPALPQGAAEGLAMIPQPRGQDWNPVLRKERSPLPIGVTTTLGHWGQGDPTLVSLQVTGILVPRKGRGRIVASEPFPCLTSLFPLLKKLGHDPENYDLHINLLPMGAQLSPWGEAALAFALYSAMGKTPLDPTPVILGTLDSKGWMLPSGEIAALIHQLEQIQGQKKIKILGPKSLKNQLDRQKYPEIFLVEDIFEGIEGLKLTKLKEKPEKQ